MNTPYPHKDLIIAWANGEEIEYFSGYTQQWSLIKHPSWHPKTTYRIKPKTAKVRAYRWAEDTCVYFVSAGSKTTASVVYEHVERGQATWVSDWFEVPLTK